MRAIVLASTALVLLPLASCDKGPADVYSALSPNVCRDARGKFAKCQTCPDGAKIWVGATCPVPPPPPPPPTPEPTWEPAPSLSGLAPIPSQFDPLSKLLKLSNPATPTAAPDVVGAFRFVCDAGQLNYDDPIVYPRQPGKSHLHQYYGNTGANANSTYASLRAGTETTCGDNPLNLSAYWMPAMLDGKGNVVRPEHVQIYYKRRPKSDPKCSLANPGAEGDCVDLPNGLKFIFGYDMVTGKGPTGSIFYQCVATGTPQIHEANLDAPSIVNCPTSVTGARVTATIKAPDCWDGKNLDSPNHRDHVAYSALVSGGRRCPSTHPKVIPGFTLMASYPILPGDELRLWKLSSDDMHPELPRGSTFHADFFMAWDPIVKQMWHDNCINKLLSCSAGNLGNGYMMQRRLTADPRLVPLSSISG